MSLNQLAGDGEDCKRVVNALARAALASQEQCASDESLALLWDELTHGTWVVVEHFNHDGRCCAVLRPRLEASRRASDARNIEILRRILRGEQQKVIALELDLSASSVAVSAMQGARAMGLLCQVRRIPAVVFMAAHAQELHQTVNARWSSLVWEGVEHRVVSAERPAAAAVGQLSRAERHIADLLLDRLSNAEIAQVRRTSIRTVANQLASVQVKLRARGRMEVLSRLIAASACDRARMPPAA